MKDKKLNERTLWVYISFLSYLATVEVAWALIWMVGAQFIPETKEEVYLKLFLETIGPASLVFGFLAMRWALSQNVGEYKKKK